jgi:hypothetical protein
VPQRRFVLRSRVGCVGMRLGRRVSVLSIPREEYRVNLRMGRRFERVGDGRVEALLRLLLLPTRVGARRAGVREGREV